MRKLLKWLLILALVFIAVWVVVIAIWQLTDTSPSGRDLLLYLIVLPLVVLVAALGIRAAIGKIRNRGGDDDTAESGAGSPESDPQDTQDWPVHIAGAALRLPIGDEPADILEVLAEGRTRPELDDQLVDSQGFPVFASRIPDLVDEDLEDSLELPESHADEPVLHWTTEQRRSLSLTDALIENLATTSLPELLAALNPDTAEDTDSAQTQANTGDTPDIEPPRAIRVFIALPTDWTAPYQQAAGGWLKKRLEALAEDDQWPPISVELLAPTSDSQLLARLERWARDLASEQANEVALLASAHSAISADAVSRLDIHNQLFSQANPNGRIPAEGGAALLLATEHNREQLDAEQACTAHRPALGRRDTSINARGRVDGGVLQNASRQALTFSNQTADQVVCILNDAGVSSAQGVEAGEVSSGDFSHLDANSDCLHIGSACGDLGVTACVAALGLAQAKTLEASAPVMVLGTQDELERASLVVSPLDTGDEDDASEEQDNNSQA